MKILFLGDIVGRSGRNAVKKYLPDIIKKNDIDFTIVNAENSAHGFGITLEIYNELISYGIDAITLGNHAWDKQDFEKLIAEKENIVRPHNVKPKFAGNGFCSVTKNGKKVLIVNLVGKVFMDFDYTSPYVSIDKILDNKGTPKKNGYDAIVFDIHAEATSEKQIIGHYIDGMASLVVGTHTHVPTSDQRILKNGTGYLTDAGMCGDFDSVIGMNIDSSMARALDKPNKKRLEPAVGEGWVCGVIIETDNETGLCKDIKQFIKKEL